MQITVPNRPNSKNERPVASIEIVLFMSSKVRIYIERHTAQKGGL